ncbi:hypothetical protein [Craterilacuibacter sp.]|uniref:hypothetical protein n=1 Tax=Craterilacuibacter sp. TaxID=2870909 RepID=UPI003F67B14B
MTLKQKKLLLLALALFALAAIKFVLIGRYLQQDKVELPQAVTLNCNLQTACALPDGGEVTFRQAPAAGQPFVIDIRGAGEAAPKAEFAMQSMDMGFNRYGFVREGDIWSAKVHLPVCVSGSKDWLMTLLLDGQRYIIPFAVR